MRIYFANGINDDKDLPKRITNPADFNDALWVSNMGLLLLLDSPFNSLL